MTAPSTVPAAVPSESAGPAHRLAPAASPAHAARAAAGLPLHGGRDADAVAVSPHGLLASSPQPGVWAPPGPHSAPEVDRQRLPRLLTRWARWLPACRASLRPALVPALIGMGLAFAAAAIASLSVAQRALESQLALAEAERALVRGLMPPPTPGPNAATSLPAPGAAAAADAATRFSAQTVYTGSAGLAGSAGSTERAAQALMRPPAAQPRGAAAEALAPGGSRFAESYGRFVPVLDAADRMAQNAAERRLLFSQLSLAMQALAAASLAAAAGVSLYRRLRARPLAPRGGVGVVAAGQAAPLATTLPHAAAAAGPGDAALAARVAQHLPLVAVYWDQNRRCRYATRAFADWWGWKPEALIGRPMVDIIGHAGVASDDEVLRSVPAGRPVQVQRSLRTRDGRRVEARLDFIPDCRDGVVQGCLFALTDITALKQSEQRLRRANQALVEARDAAEAASRAKGGFLAAMSHEIRTPLNAILGLNHLLHRQLADTPHAERLAKVGDAAQHLMAILNDVLDLSKIEAGHLSLSLTDFDRDDWLERCVGLVADEAQHKGLRLIVDVLHTPPRLRGDFTRLTQALLNLLGNAVKFTDQGWVLLRVERFDEPGAGGTAAAHMGLRVSVQDTGPGIAAEHLPRLFTHYGQLSTHVDAGTSAAGGLAPASDAAAASPLRSHGGTGLGLAIVRRLAQAMGGDVGVDSREGAGSRFWFTVSLPKAEPTLSSLPTLLAGRRILVVDDLPPARRALAGMLSGLGAQVLQATDPHDARRTIDCWQPHWTLMPTALAASDGQAAWPALARHVAARGGQVALLGPDDAASETAVARDPSDPHGLSDANDRAGAVVHARLCEPATPRRLLHALAGQLDSASGAARARRIGVDDSVTGP